ILSWFWWQTQKGKQGIYWCSWKTLCFGKEYGGMEFWNFAKFNLALLAKQGWQLMEHPNSLLARTLKAKYFPNTNFMQSKLGNYLSYTWRSVWAMKNILLKGMVWRVGKGDNILIW
ncbi:hypothetical protein ES319_D03G059700v1, partial [Gossypium barbadense]